MSLILIKNDTSRQPLKENIWKIQKHSPHKVSFQNLAKAKIRVALCNWPIYYSFCKITNRCISVMIVHFNIEVAYFQVTFNIQKRTTWAIEHCASLEFPLGPQRKKKPDSIWTILIFDILYIQYLSFFYDTMS